MYSLLLTDREVSDLGFLADRGYFPSEIYDDMALADGEFDPDDSSEVPADLERRWEFSESVAWSLPLLRESDPDAYLSCLGGDLLDKVLKLAESIV